MRKTLLIVILLSILAACAARPVDEAAHMPPLAKPFHPIMP